MSRINLWFFCVFTPSLSLCWTAWQLYRLSHINALCINLSYLPKDQSLKFSQKILGIGRSGKWQFLVFGYCFSKKKKIPNENQLSFHMRYHLFPHYGWFLQNVWKNFIQTNMHTTVALQPRQKLGMILVNKVVWKLKLPKHYFNKKCAH